MAQIKLHYSIYESWENLAHTNGFDFLNKQGKTILKFGRVYGKTEVFNIEVNEQVIGIKAKTCWDLKHVCHGALYNLQFKIAKLI